MLYKVQDTTVAQYMNLLIDECLELRMWIGSPEAAERDGLRLTVRGIHRGI